MLKKLIPLIVILLTCSTLLPAANKKFTLVIDAGHGGRDAGAVGATSKEKDLTLKFALAFGAVVERNCPDVKVIYTRKTDKFIELIERAEIANRNKADLFISVHINSLPKGHVARGFQTYTLGKGQHTGTGFIENLEVAKRENSVILLEKNYEQVYQGFDPKSPESNIMFDLIQDKHMVESVELARLMQKYVCASTGRANLGAHQDNLAVLRLSSMPGCLIELGFISTRDEETFMNSAEAPAKYANGIYNAFMAWRKKYDKNMPQTYKPEPEVKQPVQQVIPQQTKEEPQQAKQPEQTTKPSPGPQQPTITPQPDTLKTAPATAAPQPLADLPQAADKQTADEPVFKVQILVSNKPLKANDPQFKGLTGVDSYDEKGMKKYTVGSSTDLNEITRIKKEVQQKFPQAFIVAFIDGKRTDTAEAISIYRANKSKQKK